MFKIKHFNELTANDMYEIAKSRYEVFACEQKIFCENDFDDVDKNCYHIFSEKDGEIISYARIIPKNFSSYKEASIGRVLVLPKYRGNSLARKMILSCIDFIQNTLNEKHIVLSSQEYIKSLYASLGFKKISDTYIEANIPHVKMKL